MIRVHELSRVFRSGRRDLIAVDRISFSVSAGEVYGLLGPNGAGKTTTLRMILGLLKPTSGETEVAGFRATEQPNEVKRRVGMVSAGSGLYQWLTPHELLLFFGDLYGVVPAVARARLQELADLLDFSSFLHQRCSTLSTGQKQRVNLARALIHDPPVMLLDEPTSGLDVVGSQVVFSYVDHIRCRGKAVIVCTHHLDDAQRLCNRFGLLHRGRLQCEGTLSELQEQTGRATLFEVFSDLVRDDTSNRVVPS